VAVGLGDAPQFARVIQPGFNDFGSLAELPDDALFQRNLFKVGDQFPSGKGGPAGKFV
jgi:hypothetical protein